VEPLAPSPCLLRPPRSAADCEGWKLWRVGDCGFFHDPSRRTGLARRRRGGRGGGEMSLRYGIVGVGGLCPHLHLPYEGGRERH
jgi:hypothetical protein